MHFKSPKWPLLVVALVLLWIFEQCNHHQKNEAIEIHNETLNNYYSSNTTTDPLPQQQQHQQLRSYTYSNCPFIMAKFSAYELSFSSSRDTINNNNNNHNETLRNINGDSVQNNQLRDLAQKSLKVSNDFKAYQRIATAYQKGAYNNRRIILDGDSLTRQLFISTSCMLWSMGYVEDYTINNYDVWAGGQNSILTNFHYIASERFIKEASVTLRGGGKIYYIDYFNHEEKKMNHYFDMTQRVVHGACSSSGRSDKFFRRRRRRQYKARYSFNQQPLPLNKDDVVVVAAGHHNSSRETYISAYKQFFNCIKNDDDEEKKDLFEEYPHFFYQLSSVQSFWTTDGEYDSPPIEEEEEGTTTTTCRPNVDTAKYQKQDIDTFANLVPLIANEIDLKRMGEYHVGHGDCTHWVQPGLPDIFAAQLADMLLERLPGQQIQNIEKKNKVDTLYSGMMIFAFLSFFLYIWSTSTARIRKSQRIL